MLYLPVLPYTRSSLYIPRASLLRLIKKAELCTCCGNCCRTYEVGICDIADDVERKISSNRIA